MRDFVFPEAATIQLPPLTLVPSALELGFEPGSGLSRAPITPPPQRAENTETLTASHASGSCVAGLGTTGCSSKQACTRRAMSLKYLCGLLSPAVEGSQVALHPITLAAGKARCVQNAAILQWE